jgi:hypothetical protein
MDRCSSRSNHHYDRLHRWTILVLFIIPEHDRKLNMKDQIHVTLACGCSQSVLADDAAFLKKGDHLPCNVHKRISVVKKLERERK